MPDATSRPWANYALLTLAGLLALIGAILVVGGLWLALLGGSLYYLLAGAGLIASGYFLWRRSVLGMWIYLAIFGLSWIWALAEVGLAGWPLVPRVVAPSVLLLAVLAVAPLLQNAERWRSSRLRYGGFAAYVGVAWIAIAIANQPTPARALPSGIEMGVTGAGENWPAYAGGDMARHFSPLNQIDTDNVRTLERVWVMHTGALPPENQPNAYAAETTPIKIGDMLYLCSAMNEIIAVDSATGEVRWRHDPRVSHANIPYSATCRGVAYYETPNASAGNTCAQRIVAGTLDARLIEVDAQTGTPCTGFGNGGEVDTTADMGVTPPGMVAITAAPTIVRGTIVIGHQILDGQRRDAPSGVVLGYDVVTGERKWAWDLGNNPQNTPLAEGEQFTRGTPNFWTTAAADEELGLVYLPLGNAAVDYWSGSRSPQENEYSSSLVALNAETGALAWSFQTVHVDVWDYDLGSQPTLIDYPAAGGSVPALILASKQGDIYILDRRNGRPLTGVAEMPAPQGGVEPNNRTATQPHSQFHTLAGDRLRASDMWGMSPIDQMICRIQFRRAAYDGMYTPPTADRFFIEYPSYNGGSDWGGVAVDPRNGLIIANYNNMANYDRLVPREEAERRGWVPRDESGAPAGAESGGDPQAGSPYAIRVIAGWRMPVTGLPCTAPPFGGIRAIDIRTGGTVWDRPIGTARRDGPFGIPSMLPITIGTPNNGGPLVTAGGLVFVAAATDNLIRAIDIRTGRVVWSDVLPGGGQATPMTYESNGRQYIVIMAGGHHFMKTPVSDALVAYALPSRT